MKKRKIEIRLILAITEHIMFKKIFLLPIFLISKPQVLFGNINGSTTTDSFTASYLLGCKFGLVVIRMPIFSGCLIFHGIYFDWNTIGIASYIGRKWKCRQKKLWNVPSASRRILGVVPLFEISVAYHPRFRALIAIKALLFLFKADGRRYVVQNKCNIFIVTVLLLWSPKQYTII